jgi:hypothetical protein
MTSLALDSRVRAIECASRHRLVVKEEERTKLALKLASEENVCRSRQIVGEREILVDDLDAHGARIDRPMEMHGVAFEAKISMARRKVSGDDLNERRLACAVVAHQADHLTREDLHVHAMERANCTEFLADSIQLQHGFPGRRYHADPPIDPSMMRCILFARSDVAVDQ